MASRRLIFIRGHSITAGVRIQLAFVRTALTMEPAASRTTPANAASFAPPASRAADNREPATAMASPSH